MSHHHPHHHEAVAPSAGRGILIGVVVVVLLLAAVFAALWINRAPNATEAEDAARSAERAKNLSELQAADNAALTTYGWNDQAKGVVRIPVTKAMQLVLPSLNAKGTAATGASKPASPSPTPQQP